jgi:tRNA G18 (ribose-2'-O)-methylase SpoU
VSRPVLLFCAGLCRTCEVFGAAALVVGSRQCASDRQFLHLSVSAEQWLPLVEVSRKYLLLKFVFVKIL